MNIDLDLRRACFIVLFLPHLLVFHPQQNCVKKPPVTIKRKIIHNKLKNIG